MAVSLHSLLLSGGAACCLLLALLLAPAAHAQARAHAQADDGNNLGVSAPSLWRNCFNYTLPYVSTGDVLICLVLQPDTNCTIKAVALVDGRQFGARNLGRSAKDMCAALPPFFHACFGFHRNGSQECVSFNLTMYSAPVGEAVDMGCFPRSRLSEYVENCSFPCGTLACGGVTHGLCIGGVCYCVRGWGGPNCEQAVTLPRTHTSPTPETQPSAGGGGGGGGGEPSVSNDRPGRRRWLLVLLFVVIGVAVVGGIAGAAVWYVRKRRAGRFHRLDLEDFANEEEAVLDE